MLKDIADCADRLLLGKTDHCSVVVEGGAKPTHKLAKTCENPVIKIPGSAEASLATRRHDVVPVLIEWAKSVDIIEQKLKKRRES